MYGDGGPPTTNTINHGPYLQPVSARQGGNKQPSQPAPIDSARRSFYNPGGSTVWISWLLSAGVGSHRDYNQICAYPHELGIT